MRAALVIQTSFLGDVVLTTPLIAELAAKGPVDVITTPAAAPLLANNPAIRQVVAYDKRGRNPTAPGFLSLARSIRTRFAEAEDRVAVLAQGSWRSAALAFVAGFPERVGFDTSAGRPLYTRRVAYREDQHHAERLWRLAAPLGTAAPPADALRPRLYPGQGDQAQVDALLDRSGYGGEPLLALAPGSVWATKRWPSYAELAAALTADHGVRIVIVGGSDDAALSRAVIAACRPPHAPIDATGQLSLLASADLIGRCIALVTNDSAPQHFASAMQTPTVSIFGPTVPAFGFGPLAPAHAVAGVQGLACRPCDRHGPRECPLGHWRCMRDLTITDVQALVERIGFPEGA